MTGRWRLLLTCVLCAAVLSTLSGSARRAAAQTAPACSGTWSADPRDARVLTVDCSPGFASTKDRIRIYPRGAATPAGDWRQALDMRDAVWVFESGSTGKASLIVDFRPDGGSGVVALLYDDQSGDASVAHVLRDGLPAVTESAWPTVRVTAPDGWWMRDGRINLNLEIEVDGAVHASFGSVTYFSLLKHDGRSDYRLRVGDKNGDGRPDWQLNRAYPPVPDDWSVYRSILIASVEGDQPITGYLFWPYLGGETYGIVKPYLVSPPPIQVNWSQAKIVTVGEFVASHGGANAWYVESVRAFGPDIASPVANFENPFAFYDLAGKGDGYPDLQIRNVQVVPGDLVETPGATPTDNPFLKSTLPINVVRYSWDQDHSRSWDFKVDLLGRHPVDDLVQFPGFSVQTVAYDRLPRWVVDKEWDAATFIAAERDMGWTTEGIYEWSTGAVRGTYLVGGNPQQAADQAFSELPEGVRGEYRLGLDDQPFLYVSPVDGRLHLRGAQEGMFAMGRGHVLKYQSLGGDLIDQWASVVDGQPTATLSYVADHLLLETAEGVSFKRVGAHPPPALLLPPTDHASWSRLAETVSRARLGPAADDPAALFSRYEGTAWLLPNAKLSDLGLKDGEVRFALHLPDPTTRPTSQVGVPSWAARLQPGDYWVSYTTERGFNVQPQTPARLSVASVSAAVERPAALEPVVLQAKVLNQGTTPAAAATITLSARPVGGHDAKVIGALSVDVPSAGSSVVEVEWAFPTGGEWTVEAVVGASGRGTTSLYVEPLPAPDLRRIVQAQGRGSHFGLVSALVLAAATIAAAFAGSWLVAPRRRA